MKIHVFGNVLNWGVIFGGLLHRAGHDVTVFVARNERSSYQPEWEIQDAGEQALPYVQYVDIDLKRLLTGNREARGVLRRLGECDVIQTFGEYAVWAMLTGRPYVVLSYGWDLAVLPFATGGIKAWTLRLLARRAFRRARPFVYALPAHAPLIQKLKLANAVWDPHAVPLDTDRYAPVAEEERRALRRQFPQRRVFFHGARQEWTRRAANDKGNDRLFRAYARYVREYEPSSLLIAVRKGSDLAASQRLVEELGIEAHVRWIDELNKRDLVRLLNSVDAFCDQFAHGYYGVASLEAMSCAVPTFVYLDERQTGGISVPPVYSARTEDQIFSSLVAFSEERDPEERRRASRDWVLRHHAGEVVIQRYARRYRESASARALPS